MAMQMTVKIDGSDTLRQMQAAVKQFNELNKKERSSLRQQAQRSAEMNDETGNVESRAGWRKQFNKHGYFGTFKNEFNAGRAGEGGDTFLRGAGRSVSAVERGYKLLSRGLAFIKGVQGDEALAASEKKQIDVAGRAEAEWNEAKKHSILSGKFWEKSANAAMQAGRLVNINLTSRAERWFASAEEAISIKAAALAAANETKQLVAEHAVTMGVPLSWDYMKRIAQNSYQNHHEDIMEQYRHARVSAGMLGEAARHGLIEWLGK